MGNARHAPAPNSQYILDEDILASSGGDLISIVLTGPEHIVAPVQLVGPCTYRLTYRCVLPGRYNLRVFLLSSYFSEAFVGHAPPPSPADDVLGLDTFLSLGQVMPPEDMVRLHSAVLSGDGLPPCEPGKPVPGRWVSRSPPEKALLPSPVATKCFEAEKCSRIFPFKGWTDSGRLVWVPYNCSRRHFTLPQKRNCLANKRVLLHGESHARYLLRSLAMGTVNPKLADRLAYTEHTYRRTCARTFGPRGVVCFSWDPFGDKLPEALNLRQAKAGSRKRARSRLRRSPRLLPQTARADRGAAHARALRAPSDEGAGGASSAPWDLVSVSVGTWLVSGGTIRMLNSTMRSRILAATTRLSGNTTLLWWTPQAGPAPGGRRFAHTMPFPGRLTLLRRFAAVVRTAVSDIASTAPRPAALQVGDIMDASEGVIHFANDGAHLTMVPYQALLVEEMLSVLCPGT